MVFFISYSLFAKAAELNLRLDLFIYKCTRDLLANFEVHILFQKASDICKCNPSLIVQYLFKIMNETKINQIS